jgi:hypothetical protein
LVLNFEPNGDSARSTDQRESPFCFRPIARRILPAPQNSGTSRIVGPFEAFQDLLKRYDVNDYAASVKAFAVKPSRYARTH